MSTVIGGPLGLNPPIPPVDREVFNRCGATVAIGDLVMFDLGNSDAAASNNIIGDSRSGFANVITPNENPGTVGQRALQFGIFGVVVSLGTGGGIDNTKVTVRLRGIVDANVDATVVAGDPLVATTTTRRLDEISAVAGSMLKVLAIALEADTSNIASVLFDGIYGFGRAVST